MASRDRRRAQVWTGEIERLREPLVVTIVWTMKPRATDHVLAALQQAVGTALKNWLNENKTEIIQLLRAAMPMPQGPKSPAKTAVDPKGEAKFLTVAEVATRWKLHPATVRRMLRKGRLPCMLLGRRALVPMTAIAECEKQGWVAD